MNDEQWNSCMYKNLLNNNFLLKLSLLYKTYTFHKEKWIFRIWGMLINIQLFGSISSRFSRNIMKMYTQYDFVSVSLIVWVFVPFENFSLIWRNHHYRWRAANFYLAFDLAVRVLQRAVPTVTGCIRIKWSFPRTRDTNTCYGTFCSGAVITCFYYLALSRLWFEQPTFRIPGERSNRLRTAAATLSFIWTYFDKFLITEILQNMR